MPVTSFCTRRQFSFTTLGGLAFPAPRTSAAAPPPWATPARVKSVYLATAKPSWPNPRIDLTQIRADIDAHLAELVRNHPSVARFSGGEIVRTADETASWLKAAATEDLDAILAIPLTSATDGLAVAVGKSGLPALLYQRPYLGHSWGSFAALARAGHKADLVATSDYADLDVYLRIFRTIRHLRMSKVIVVVPNPEPHSREAEQFHAHFGATFRYLTYADLKQAYDAADARQAAQAADAVIHGALRVLEPSRDDVLRALRFYLGVEDLLRREQANAIAIDCLGGINRGELPGYPCIAWSKLDDQGLYGVCQADLPCAVTQLLLTSFSGKPGFVFNTVFDTSRNEVIQSHCVAPTALYGPGGPRSPYILRSHLETAAGVSMQVLLPIAETVTVARFENPRRLLVSTADVLGNVDSPDGCRTQIRTRVRDARKLLEGYSGGLGVHRVSFYCDYLEPLRKMGRLMSFEVVREG